MALSVQSFGTQQELGTGAGDEAEYTLMGTGSFGAGEILGPGRHIDVGMLPRGASVCTDNTVLLIGIGICGRG